METSVRMGEVIAFSGGEYSDYSYCGLVVFRKACDLMEAKEAFKKFTIATMTDGYCESDRSTFVTWLVANEYCLPLEEREIHLGSYGELLGESTYDWEEIAPPQAQEE